ncbi:MAG: metallopeptidase family protein [Elusimicrobiota bacterium]|jgi:predicted Zn-dependent protease with MMP-like domain
MRVSRGEFDRLAEAALQGIPRRFRDLIVNLEISIRARPGPEAGRDQGSRRLLGLYLGPDRTALGGPFCAVAGARIVLYQNNIESGCRDAEELERQIRLTLRHELAHHFGFTDAELRMKWPEGA